MIVEHLHVTIYSITTGIHLNMLLVCAFRKFFEKTLLPKNENKPSISLFRLCVLHTQRMVTRVILQ